MRMFKKWIVLILEFGNLKVNYPKRMRSAKGTGMFRYANVDNLC